MAGLGVDPELTVVNLRRLRTMEAGQSLQKMARGTFPAPDPASGRYSATLTASSRSMRRRSLRSACS